MNLMETPRISDTSTMPGSRFNPGGYLINVIQELSLARGLPAVMGVVKSAARNLTGADGVTFVLRDGDLCHYADEDAISPLWKGMRFPMSACISGWVMQNGQSAAIEDIYADERIPADAYRPTFVKSLVMTPIRNKQPIGAIGCYWARRHKASDEEIHLVRNLADSTSLVMQNIEIRKKLEHFVSDRTAQLELVNEQLEEINQRKTRYLAMLGHELRNPLAPLRTALEMLRMRLPEDQSLRDICGMMEHQVMHLRRLVDDLLDVARSDPNHIDLRLRKLDLRESVRDVVATLTPTLDKRKQRLVQDQWHDPITVNCDSMRLDQILLNLLDNASKYTPHKGRITVTTRRNDHQAELSVCDNGRGISPEFQDKLFDEYFQAPTDDNAPGSDGLGIGLSLVKQLVTLHGGSIDVRSEGKDRGSEFILRLPLVSTR